MAKQYQGPEIGQEEAGRMANEVYASILDWFETMGLEETRDELERWFDAAIADRYCWSDGPPGNCLWLYDQMLALIGELHTLWRLGEYVGGMPPRSAEMARSKRKAFLLYAGDLPCLLSAEECDDPMRVVAEFFSFRNYEEWADDLHDWLDAALSHGSVTENVDTAIIMPFCRHLRRLLEAGHVLAVQMGRWGQTPVAGYNEITEAYSEIVVTGWCKVKLTRSDRQSIELQAGTILGDVLYEVDNGVLTIAGVEEDTCPELVVRYCQMDDLLVKDLSEVEITERHDGPHLRVIAMGAANVSGAIVVDHLEAFAVNSGWITLSGSAAIAQVSGRDEGDCRLAGMMAGTVKATLRDSAKAEIQVSHVLDYAESEEGTLSYQGEPAIRVRDAVSGNWVCIFNPAQRHHTSGESLSS